MNLRHISAAAALAVLLPFAASALTADDIRQQIQSLLTQIAQLQQQLKQTQTSSDSGQTSHTVPCCKTFTGVPGSGAVNGVNTVSVQDTPPGDAAFSTRGCPVFTRTLTQGISGSDVSQLQQYLGVSPTGYFGTVTANAVAQFQANEGLSRVGSVGPQTRAAFARRCGGGGGIVSKNFSASRTSGSAPLTVKFETTLRATLDANVANGFYYRVYFGDGESGELDIRGLSHTYASAGTYTATLTKIFSCSDLPGVPTCTPPPRQIAGTVTISVSGSQAGGEKTEELFEYVGKVAARSNELERWKVKINTNLLTDSSVKKFKINLFDGHTYDVERYEDGIQRSQCNLYQGGRGCYAWVGYISGRSCFGYDTVNKKCSPAETVMFLGGTDSGIVGTIPAAVGLNNFSYSISGNADGYFIAKPDPSKLGLD